MPNYISNMKCHNQNCNQEADNDWTITSDGLTLSVPLCRCCTFIVKDNDFSYLDSYSSRN